uniref:Putative secreted protein n=1 Tax=Ixodes ricinus TaxID=34613 RepID=A0A147BU15_IXORI
MARLPHLCASGWAAWALGPPWRTWSASLTASAPSARLTGSRVRTTPTCSMTALTPHRRLARRCGASHSAGRTSGCVLTLPIPTPSATTQASRLRGRQSPSGRTSQTRPGQGATMSPAGGRPPGGRRPLASRAPRGALQPLAPTGAPAPPQAHRPSGRTVVATAVVPERCRRCRSWGARVRQRGKGAWC